MQGPAASRVAWSREQDQRHALLLQAMAPAPCLYAVVDCALHGSLYAQLQNEPAESEIQCLYDGMPAVRYARVAPYLLHVHRNSPIYRRWLAEGWLQHWGIFIAASLTTRQIRRHLKKFLTVRLPGWQTAHLRFYDPRVLCGLLQQADPGQVHDLLRVPGEMPFATFLVPQTGQSLVAYSSQGNALFNRLTRASHLQTRYHTVAEPCS
ncbi:Uncharacterised protein [Delftia tsuruhatensis]|uniref:DUF4123 domain-containing protein n=1 Tax=Delftia tsuruhatensis TaxID=180282 RepID=UPI001E785BA8|nr:DUF4123 domain-containing protein [Delftia tsuruhatensis]CAB5663563.1 Uncharacterised protein [Delftia tsuruhatensis]CAC9677330.1 Uncharacterised protein [Delftia tsuruhatensis]